MHGLSAVRQTAPRGRCWRAGDSVQTISVGSACPGTTPNARIVLTTFNATVAQGLRADLALLDHGLTIAEKPGDIGVYVAAFGAPAPASTPATIAPTRHARTTTTHPPNVPRMPRAKLTSQDLDRIACARKPHGNPRQELP